MGLERLSLLWLGRHLHQDSFSDRHERHEALRKRQFCSTQIYTWSVTAATLTAGGTLLSLNQIWAMQAAREYARANLHLI